MSKKFKFIVNTVIAESNATLEVNSQVFFNPNADRVGALEDAFSYPAWDQTNSLAAILGAKLNAALTGVSTHYSFEVAQMGISVTAVSDTPSVLAGALHDLKKNTGAVLTNALKLNFADVDGHSQAGVIFTELPDPAKANLLKPYELSGTELTAIGLTAEGVAHAHGEAAKTEDWAAAIQMSIQAHESNDYLLSPDLFLDWSRVISDRTAGGESLTSLVQIPKTADAAAHALTLSLADVLSLDPSEESYQLGLTEDSNAPLLFAQAAWAASAQAVQSHALYTDASNLPAQWLMEQQMSALHPFF